MDAILKLKLTVFPQLACLCISETAILPKVEWKIIKIIEKIVFHIVSWIFHKRNFTCYFLLATWMPFHN